MLHPQTAGTRTRLSRSRNTRESRHLCSRQALLPRLKPTNLFPRGQHRNVHWDPELHWQKQHSTGISSIHALPGVHQHKGLCQARGSKKKEKRAGVGSSVSYGCFRCKPGGINFDTPFQLFLLFLFCTNLHLSAVRL